MAKAKGGLGKGLAALIPDWNLEEETLDTPETDTPPQEDASDSTLAVRLLPIDDIQPNPWQPRQEFDEEELIDLTESIRQEGILSPLLVTEEEDTFTLVSGERRLRAARKAGLEEVPALVRPFTPEDMARIALIENIQRADLLPLEEAQGYKHLMDKYGHSPQDIADFVGKSRSHVANTVRLLQLPKALQDYLNQGALTAGHARALLSVEDPEIQADLAKDIIAKGLSVRAVEQLIASMKNLDTPPGEKIQRDAYKIDKKWKNLGDQMTNILQTQVHIRGNSKNGRLEIAFYGEEDLKRILDALHIELH